MRGSLSIFLPNKALTMSPRTLLNHKSQTGLANANLEADQNLVVEEFLPIHIKTTTGIIVLISLLFIMFCDYKAVRKGRIAPCWRVCCTTRC